MSHFFTAELRYLQGPTDLYHFQSMLPHIGSAFDLLRIQYGHWVSDEEISAHLMELLQTNSDSEPNPNNSTGNFSRDDADIDHRMLEYTKRKDVDRLVQGKATSVQLRKRYQSSVSCHIYICFGFQQWMYPIRPLITFAIIFLKYARILDRSSSTSPDFTLMLVLCIYPQVSDRGVFSTE